MQASNSWTPPGGTLGAIVEQTMQRVATLHGRRNDLEAALAGAPKVAPFATALRGHTIRVIAEVKRRSPSKGSINPNLDPATLAALYEEGGAAAVSVLTEPHHFGGSNADLESVRGHVRIPLLKKDFHVDSLQIVEARVLGASAALLIARAIEPTVLPELVALAESIGLETLVEVRSADELDRAIAAGAQVIGVNSRNLETLEVDAAVARELIRRIPAHIVAVWESGVAGPDDVRAAAAVGADAVLVGSALSAAADPVAAVRALASVARQDVARG